MSVGLDIGSKTIKLVELSGSAGDYQLRGAGAVGYSGVVVDQNTTEQDLLAVSSTLKKLYKDVKVHSKDINLALPESQVFTRVLKFPLLTDDEIANAVKYEVEDYIPIPLADAVVEHQIIERLEKSNPPKVLVLLTATTRTLVEKYVQAVTMAGLNVLSVETSLLAGVRAVAPPDRTSVIVEMGARSTEIAIARGSQMYFTRSIPTAGEAFTRSIAQAFNIPVLQADQYKQTYGFDEQQLDGRVKIAMQPVLGIITEEIKKTVHFYQMETKGETPTVLVLAGASASIPRIIETLSKAVNVEVMLANPFQNVKMDEATSHSMQPYAHLYTVATGLAMK